MPSTVSTALPATDGFASWKPSSLNYGVVDPEAADELYRKMYEDELLGNRRVHLHPFRELRKATASSGGIELILGSTQGEVDTTIQVDLIVSCTGYRTDMLGDYARDLYPFLRTDEGGTPLVRRDYAVAWKSVRERGCSWRERRRRPTGSGMRPASSNIAVRAGVIASELMGSGGRIEEAIGAGR